MRSAYRLLKLHCSTELTAKPLHSGTDRDLRVVDMGGRRALASASAA